MDKQMLIIGVGNTGRSDDGLGWKFLEEIQSLVGPEVGIEYRYQLQVEDAELLTRFNPIIIVDATVEKLEGGFSFTPCIPKNEVTCTSHRIDPASLCWLCQDLYGYQPEVHVLAIEGRRWELQEDLSHYASKHLKRALDFFSARLGRASTRTQSALEGAY